MLAKMTTKEFIKEMAEANKWLQEQMFQYQSRVELSKRMFAATLHIRTGDRVLVTMNDGEEYDAKVLTVTPMIHPFIPGEVYFSYDLLRKNGKVTNVVFNLDSEMKSISLIP